MLYGDDASVRPPGVHEVTSGIVHFAGSLDALRAHGRGAPVPRAAVPGLRGLGAGGSSRCRAGRGARGWWCRPTRRIVFDGRGEDESGCACWTSWASIRPPWSPPPAFTDGRLGSPWPKPAAGFPGATARSRSFSTAGRATRSRSSPEACVATAASTPQGRYRSPRTIHRLPAHASGLAGSPERDGHPLLAIDTALMPPQYPNVEQARLLLKERRAGSRWSAGSRSSPSSRDSAPSSATWPFPICSLAAGRADRGNGARPPGLRSVRGPRPGRGGLQATRAATSRCGRPLATWRWRSREDPGRRLACA